METCIDESHNETVLRKRIYLLVAIKVFIYLYFQLMLGKVIIVGKSISQQNFSS